MSTDELAEYLDVPLRTLYRSLVDLARDYLSTLPTPSTITWVCNHSRNTQLALVHGHIDLALLGAFAVQHSGMARPAFKRWWTRIIPEAAERSTYVLLSSLALVALFRWWQPIGGLIWSRSAATPARSRSGASS